MIFEKKNLGTDVGRTRDLRFTRATPYHLATAPFAIEKKVPSQQAIVPICDYERKQSIFDLRILLTS